MSGFGTAHYNTAYVAETRAKYIIKYSWSGDAYKPTTSSKLKLTYQKDVINQYQIQILSPN